MKVALISRAAAGYLRALHENFADAMQGEAHLDIIWPDDVVKAATQAGHLPSSSNLSVHSVASPPAWPWLARLLSVSRQEPVMPRLPTGAVWRQLKSLKPSLVWIHEFSPFTLEALLYAKLNALPLVVSSEVGRSNAHYFGRVVQLWHQFWGHFVDGFIACCPSARKPLSRTPAPVIDAFHAIDTRLFTPAASCASHSTTTFVYVGSLIERKGIDLLLNAADALRRLSSEPFKIRLIGGGDASVVTALAETLDLSSFLDITGRLEGESLRDAIRSADVFVLPTRQDTYGAVVHEAASLGLPLLVSHHAGAAKALVREGLTGFTIDPENTTSFASTMKRILDPALRSELAVAARARAEELSAHHRAEALWKWVKEEFTYPSCISCVPAVA